MQSQEAYQWGVQHESSLLGNIATGAVQSVAAVAVDLGTTIWNSVVPEEYESSTYEILGEINNDLANFYLSNKNAVELGSFIGGMLLPGFGVARAAKAASSGAGFFGKIGKLATLGYSGDKIAKYGKQAEKIAFHTSLRTKELKQAIWKQRLWTVENVVAENVLYETAFYALMNDHAYIEEDYGVDTFFYSIALGSAFTAPISLAINGRKVKDAAQFFEQRRMQQAGAAEAFTASTEATAGKYSTGTALQGDWLDTDDLWKRANAVTQHEMKDLLEVHAREQGLQAKEKVTMLLSDSLKKESEFVQAKTSGPGQPWHEWRIGATPLQTVGSYSRAHPEGLVGARSKGITPSGTAIVIGKKHGKQQTINVTEITSLNEGAYTYNQAVQLLGGNNFRVSSSLIHLVTWEGQVHKTDAVMGRVLKRAGDMGAKINPSYSIADGKKTYNPLTQGVAIVDGEIINAMQAGRAKLLVNNPIDLEDLPRLQGLALNGTSATISLPGVKKPFEANGAQIYDTMKASKILWVRKMQAAGFDPMHISIATNTPQNTVEAITFIGSDVAKLKQLQADKKTLWTVYSASEKGLQQALTPSLLEVRGNFTKTSPYDKVGQGIAVDRNFVNQVEKVAVEDIMYAAPSRMLRELYKGIVTRTTALSMEQSLWQLYSAGAEGSNFTSTDMAMRAWKDLNGTLVTAGGDATLIVNEKGIKPIVGNLQVLAEGVVKEGRAAIINFEYLRNALDAIPSGADTASKMRYNANTRQIETAFDPKTGDAIEWLLMEGGQKWKAEFDSVDNFVKNGILRASQDMWDMRRTNAKLSNVNLAQQRGVYIPYDNIADDFIAFIIDEADASYIRRVSGNNLADLKQQTVQLQQDLAGTTKKIVPRNQLDRVWNKLNDYSTLQHIQRADPSSTKKGIATGKITGSPEILDRVLRAYEADINKQSRIFLRASQGGIFSTLSNLSNFHDDLLRSSAKGPRQKIQQQGNPAKLAAKTLLNLAKTDDVPVMDFTNNATDIAIDYAASVIDTAWAGVKTKLTGGEAVAQADLDKINATLNAHNMPQPWADVQEFIQASLPQNKKQSRAVVAATSQFMTLFNIRLGEVAHGIVTTLSAPALILGEGASVLGKSPHKYMLRVGKYFFNPDQNPAMKAVSKRGKELGYTERKSSEVTATLNSAVTQKGWLQKLSAVDNQTMGELTGAFGNNPTWSGAKKIAYKAATRPSDWSEEITREYAYLVGYEISKDLSKGAHHTVHEEAANLFTMRAMGNYNPRQRPVMFQGTFGQAMGLYQTFMMTVAQNLYRNVETKNVKALTLFGGTYVGTFGMESLPLYEDVNKMVGAYLSGPDHQDITQTVYEAFGDKYSGHERSVGEFLLYGGPSALFQSAWYTRGDLDPRIPIDSGRLAPPIVVGMADFFDTMTTAAQNSYQLARSGGSGMDIGAAILEGVATQSMWRPAARLSEYGLGYSIDRKGEILSQPQDIYGIWPTFARVSGARPLKEAVLRQQRYQHRAYDTIDTQHRQKATRALRTHLRGNENSGVVGSLMQDYLRDGGTPTGWSSVLNQTYLGSEQPFGNKLLDQLKKQEGIVRIIEGYAE